MGRGKRHNRGRRKDRRYTRGGRRKPSNSPFRFEQKWPRETLTGPMWFADVAAILGMFLIYALHSSDEWGPFALAEGLMALCAVPAYFYNRAYGTANVHMGKGHTAIRAGILFLILAGIQAVARYTLNMTGYERALYYNIAAVAEEVAMRGLVCRVIAGNKNNVARGILAVVVSTAGFAAGHVSYWGDPAAMAFVIGMGISFGIAYLVWKDLAACILGHWLLNFIVSWSVLFQFR